MASSSSSSSTSSSYSSSSTPPSSPAAWSQDEPKDEEKPAASVVDEKEARLPVETEGETSVLAEDRSAAEALACANGCERVILTHIRDPGHFYYRYGRDQDVFERIMQALQTRPLESLVAHVEREERPCPENEALDLILGMRCAFKSLHDFQVYRGMVLEVYEEEVRSDPCRLAFMLAQNSRSWVRTPW